MDFRKQTINGKLYNVVNYNDFNNNRELYTSDWKAYSEATGYKLSIDADYLDTGIQIANSSKR